VEWFSYCTKSKHMPLAHLKREFSEAKWTKAQFVRTQKRDLTWLELTRGLLPRRVTYTLCQS